MTIDINKFTLEQLMDLLKRNDIDPMKVPGRLHTDIKPFLAVGETTPPDENEKMAAYAYVEVWVPSPLGRPLWDPDAKAWAMERRCIPFDLYDPYAPEGEKYKKENWPG